MNLFDQWAVDHDPILTSTTSAKIGMTALVHYPSCASSRQLCQFVKTWDCVANQ